MLEVEEPKEIAPFWVNVSRRMQLLGMKNDADLVRAAGISNTAIQSYKWGETVPRRHETVMKLARALRVSKDVLEGWIPGDKTAWSDSSTDPIGQAPYESLVRVLTTYGRAELLTLDERQRLFSYSFASGDPGDWFFLREIDAILGKRSGLHAAVRESEHPVDVGQALDESEND